MGSRARRMSFRFCRRRRTCCEGWRSGWRRVVEVAGGLAGFLRSPLLARRGVHGGRGGGGLCGFGLRGCAGGWFGGRGRGSGFWLPLFSFGRVGDWCCSGGQRLCWDRWFDRRDLRDERGRRFLFGRWGCGFRLPFFAFDRWG